MQYAHDAAGTPTPAAATGAERPGLTKQKQDRRHLARRRIAAREPGWLMNRMITAERSRAEPSGAERSRADPSGSERSRTFTDQMV